MQTISISMETVLKINNALFVDQSGVIARVFAGKNYRAIQKGLDSPIIRYANSGNDGKKLTQTIMDFEKWPVLYL